MPEDETPAATPEVVEPTPDETAPAAAAEPSTPPAAKTFTQDELNTIVQERLAADRKRAKNRSPKPQPATAPEPTNDEPPAWVTELITSNRALSQSVETLQQKARTDTFDAAFAKAGGPEAAKDDIRTLAEAAKPADLGAFIAEKSKLFGGSTPVNNPEDTATPGAPPTVRNDDSGISDPFTWTAEDVNRQISNGTFKENADRYMNTARRGSVWANRAAKK